MNDLLESSRPHVSRLNLRVAFPPDGRDAPELAISIDGVDLSIDAGRATGFRGFPVDQILPPPAVHVDDFGWSESPGELTPLLPFEARRIAVCTCLCGVPGCGVIAPVIAVDRDSVTWSDFRDFTGVFNDPDDPAPDEGGHPLPIPQLRFDRHQYESEVARVRADRSWESPARITVRLVQALLEQHDDRFSSDGYRLKWVSSAWWQDDPGRVVLVLESTRDGATYFASLTAKFGTPLSRALSIRDRLLRHPVGEWFRRFPHR
ncbi:hypothetical protein [Schumannella luteola]